MPNVFLDTNVLIYAATGREDDSRRHAIATDILSSGPIALSAQVMGEFVSVARRIAGMAEEDIGMWLDRMKAQGPLPVDAGVVSRGAEISARYRLNYYDGAIIAAAERLGCDTVLSEDMGDGQSYGSVTVRNPFKEI